MHITLILLAAAGQVVTALDPHVTHLPRAANQEDNLATITTLSDGHLPTCFTGHPTHPCPTNGPAGKRDLMGEMGGMGGLAGNPMGGLTGDINKAARIVPIDQIELTATGGRPALPTGAPRGRGRAGPRDAPMEPWDKNYIPHPSEWAVPGEFKFTDSIAHNATGHAYDAHNSTAPQYGAPKYATPKEAAHNSTAPQHGAPKYAAHDSTAHKHTGYNSIAHKYTGHKHTGYNSTAHKYTAHNSTGTTASAPSSSTSSIEKYHAAPTAVVPQSNEHLNHYNNHYAHHHNKIHQNNHHDEYVHTSSVSESVTAKAYSQTTDPPALPSTSHKQQAVANSSSEAHVAGQIGTLLSAAMFPGKMRAPATTNTSPYAAAVTSSKVEPKVDNKPDAYSTTQIQQASISTPCADSEVSSSSSSTMPMYDVKPVTMLTSSRPVTSSEAQPTASYKAAEQHTARHFVS
jgi:hypothetical protein